MNGNLMKSFDVFVGVWNTTGNVLKTADTPTAKLIATDTYHWLPGRKFLVHHADARFDDQPARSMEIVGYDSSTKKHVSRSYDDQGKTEIFNVELNGKDWVIVGDMVRFNGQFDAGFNSLFGLWEMKVNSGDWQPWIELRLVRD